MSDDIPYLRRLKAKEGIGKAGRKSEKTIAKHIGGRLTPASGAMPGAKGDMTMGDFLIEAKSTVSDSLTLKSEWLRKIAKEARQTHKQAALSISFTKEDGTPWMDSQWVAIPLHVFKDLVDGKTDELD